MREERITMSKAIAIMLMVVCHAGLPSVPSHFIAMFHMPLFFFVSGYCFKDKYLTDNRWFMVNKIKGLYIPFVKWSLLFLLLHNVFFYLNLYNGEYGFHGGVSRLYGWNESARNVAKIMISMSETEQLLGGYWFLKQLFVGSILSLLTFKFVKNNIFGGGVWLLVTILLSYMKIELPILHIGSLSSFSTFFIVMGRAYKQIKLNVDSPIYTLLYFVLVAMGSVYCGVSMLDYTVLQVVPYALCALMGTVMVLNISEWFCKYNCRLKSFLLFVGDHTLEVLTWHFITFKIVSLFIIWIHRLPIEQLACFPTVKGYGIYYWPLYSLVGIGLPILVVYLRKKHFIYGKTK